MTNTKAQKTAYLRKIRETRERATTSHNALELLTYAELSLIAAYNARNPKLARPYIRSAASFYKQAKREMAQCGIMVYA